MSRNHKRGLLSDTTAPLLILRVIFLPLRIPQTVSQIIPRKGQYVSFCTSFWKYSLYLFRTQGIFPNGINETAICTHCARRFCCSFSFRIRKNHSLWQIGNTPSFMKAFLPLYPQCRSNTRFQRKNAPLFSKHRTENPDGSVYSGKTVSPAPQHGTPSAAPRF